MFLVVLFFLIFFKKRNHLHINNNEIRVKRKEGSGDGDRVIGAIERSLPLFFKRIYINNYYIIQDI